MSTTISGTTGISQVQDGVIGSTKLADQAVTPTKLSQPITSVSLVPFGSFTTTTYNDFTGIPNWATRITVIFSGLSWSSATPSLRIQIGSGSIDATGYTGAMCLINSAPSSAWVGQYSTGFDVESQNVAADTVNGFVTLVKTSGNTWALSGVLPRTSGAIPAICFSSGIKSLSGALDRVRVTTSNGTDTFDAGSVGLIYE